MRGIFSPRCLSSEIAHKLVASIILFASLAGISGSAAGFPLDQDDLLEDVGQFSPSYFAELLDVELDGDRAYVFGVGGMAIFDITNAALPVELGRYEPVNHPWARYYRGAVNGTVVCAGGREDLLAIIDVSNPVLPTLTTIHGISGTSYEGAAMRGSHVYACRHGDGLEIVDISNPALPVTASVVKELVNAWDVDLAGDIAYVADGMGGLAVIDVANPAAAVHVTSVPASGAAVDVVVSGDIAVVCSGGAGIDIFDLTNPLAPVLISTANTSGLAITAAIAGDLVYVADWDDVEVFDLGNPAQPMRVGGEDTPVRAMGLAARADLVVVADWSRLRLYNTGPSTRGDIQVSVESVNLGHVPLGATVDTTIILGNTGGAPLNVSNVQDFGGSFEVLNPGPFVIPVGGTVAVTIRFTHVTAGYEATFIRIDSDDSDEPIVAFAISADDNPTFLNPGDEAPAWLHLDTDVVVHQLSDYRGRVVVMAFFANW